MQLTGEQWWPGWLETQRAPPGLSSLHLCSRSPRVCPPQSSLGRPLLGKSGGAQGWLAGSLQEGQGLPELPSFPPALAVLCPHPSHVKFTLHLFHFLIFPLKMETRVTNCSPFSLSLSHGFGGRMLAVHCTLLGHLFRGCMLGPSLPPSPHFMACPLFSPSLAAPATPGLSDRQSDTALWASLLSPLL